VVRTIQTAASSTTAGADHPYRGFTHEHRQTGVFGDCRADDRGELLLGLYVSPYWYWFTAFVGANLLQSAFTGFAR
jgi:hypothetical protein